MANPRTRRRRADYLNHCRGTDIAPFNILSQNKKAQKDGDPDTAHLNVDLFQNLMLPFSSEIPTTMAPLSCLWTNPVSTDA